ncbi:MAG: hypothetical protein B7Z75_08895 [Acidocella sp. 20-57-95]|nr:MAG: hypothetical protein B7Z75_08895 [Acidocella sp. 20-57-95]OYV57811.1 MAG: hypothetical protein B7Z71_12040 [Acidocella sp. 21-58-7]HQT64226.1 cell division protein FtsX [Acidocella sp.]HQU05488.1 cell division protein FtsX [Acidocella sp.]
MAKKIDHLGLRSAMADRLLPVLVAAMSFLAALAVAGTLAASSLAGQWNQNTGADLTVQVPDPGDQAVASAETRLQAVFSVLAKSPGVNAPHVLTADEVNNLLRPWLGQDAGQLGLPVPAVITAQWSGAGAPDALRAALDAVAPGTLAETGTHWAERVAALTASLQASALSVLLIVTLVASAVVAVATRAGLAQGRDAIEIIHGLGTLDSDIAGRFAARVTMQTAFGAVLGTLCALPVLFWLASLALPFTGVTADMTRAASLPPVLWVVLPSIPVLAACIGWVTTQFTVRGWLRRLS